MAAIYRIRQFVRAAGAWAKQVDSEIAPRYLPPAGIELFRAMPRYDRQHALNVLRCLQESGHSDPDLLAAALLHDVGKTANQPGALRLWHRVVVVVMLALRPGLLEHIGQDQPGSWRQPFFVQEHHAAISAELARQAGCSAETVDLIYHHEDPPSVADSPHLAALQAADSSS